MSVNRIRLRTLSDDGNKRAALALDILENKTPKMLSAILIGNNIVNVYASSLATTLAYHLGGYMVSIAHAGSDGCDPGIRRDHTKKLCNT